MERTGNAVTVQQTKDRQIVSFTATTITPPKPMGDKPIKPKRKDFGDGKNTAGLPQPIRAIDL